jgi:Icc-related predicted phosphoesterase
VARCLFATDLHGHTDRYDKLISAIEERQPGGVFIGGDLLPGGILPAAAIDAHHADFVHAFLLPRFLELRRRMEGAYPRIFTILGNDDPRAEEISILEGAIHGAWEYVHQRKVRFDDLEVYGYGFIPPSPFSLKDWERYDVSRYVDPGSVSPEEGWTSVPRAARESRHATIARDLDALVGTDDLSRAIFLFHTPPYDTPLDRAALDGRMVDHVPLDVHVGSIAVRRFIETRGPRLTLHGHVHEAVRLTGEFMTRIGNTVCLSAAHDGPELAVVEFDPDDAGRAIRFLL